MVPPQELVRTADAVGGLASQCAACTPHSQEGVLIAIADLKIVLLCAE